MSVTSNVKRGVRNNAEVMGVGLPIVIAWAAREFGGIEIPTEVAVAIGGVLGSMFGKVKKAF